MRASYLRMLSATLCVIASIVASVPCAKAQVLYGAFTGTVADHTGAVVPGAEVTATNQATGLSRHSAANNSGQYQILDLPAGTYTISVSSTGFNPLTMKGVGLVAGQVNQQNLQLQIGTVSESVTVQGSALELQTEKVEVHTTVSTYAVENLPMNVYQNVQGLELLAPGVFSTSAISNNYPNSLADAPDRSYEINSNGLSAHINTTRVDGATNVFLWLPDHMVIVPPAATIEEVNVQTATNSVEKGLTAGAATDIITKSGTNALHGSAYGFHSDQAMDAQNALLKMAKTPKLIQNNDGVTLGGPIKKNKLFYFGNWDGYIQRQSVTDTNLIPTTDMRKGDFSSYLGTPLFDASSNPAMVCTTEGGMTQLRQGMVFDPTSGNPATGQNRCVFSSGGKINVIPQNRMNAGAANYWGLLPAPNVGGPFTVSTPYNDITSRSQAWNRNIYTSRVDYNISDRQLLWGKYSLQKALLNDAGDFGVAGTGAGSGITDDTAQTATIGHNYTVANNLVFTGHIGFTRMGESGRPPDYGTDYGQTVLQLANSNTPAGDMRYSGMPQISMTGFSALGGSQGWTPFTRNDWTVTLDENGRWIHGNHQVTFGFDAAHNHINEWQLGSNCCLRGAITDNPDNTFLNLAPAGNPTGAQGQVYTLANGALQAAGFNSSPWNSVALFDLGLTSEALNDQEIIKAASKDWAESLYVGDMWRATPKLTVNAGLRWEYYSLPIRDGAAKSESYNPSTNVVTLGGLGGNSDNLGSTTSKKLFAPRIGLAYRLDNNTVIRSGFGINYDSMPLERPLRQFWPFDSPADNIVAGNSNVTRFLPYGTFNSGNPNNYSGLAVGVPLITAPSGFYQGSLTPPSNVTIGGLAPGEFKRGYVESWNLSLERKLPGQVLLNVAYVGNHMVHELNGQDMNAAPLGTGTAGQPQYAAFGRTGRYIQFQGYLDSHYNSLQVSLNRHVAHGLFLQGAYTYSKTIGYTDDIDGAAWDGLIFECPASAAMPKGCLPLNRHTLNFDHTQVLTMGFVYSLPFDRWLHNRVAHAVASGWQTNGIFTAYSGDPLSPSQTGSYLNTPRTSQVPDYAGGLQMIGGTGPGQHWFNTSAFVPVQSVRIGTAGEGLSWLRGPGVMQLDLSLFRDFKIKERFNFQMKAQAQNLSNTPHFNDPNMTCTIVTQPNGQNACGGSFGQITGSFGQRIVQVGAKLSF
jgi:Carboxypeptidase regulatory-like domain/TonB dependent receptor